MKTLHIIGVAALLTATLSGCDDFLDENRYPLSQQVSNTEFWNNASNVQGQINAFYEDFSGYGNGSGSGEFYFTYLSDDQANATSGTSLYQWHNINVPTSSSSWNNPYKEIRRANLIIEGVANSTLTESEKANFTGIARLMRGLHYYYLVRCYGDVPLVEKALDPNDEAELFGPRTPRNEVMDFAIADIEYACNNIGATKSKNAFCKDMAKAIKSEVTLYEASYAKYHQGDEARANKYYDECAAVSDALLDSYPVGEDYAAIYNSFRGELSANPEIIWMKEYEPDVFMHCTVDYTSSSSPVAGMTKDAFDAFLFRDGQPLASTTLDKSDKCTKFPQLDAQGEVIKDEKGNILYNLSIKQPLSVRDARLSAITDTAIYYVGQQYKRPNSMQMTSITGYGVLKFYSPEMSYEYTSTIKNYTCAPLYWGACIALNLAEAKAERGNISDTDLDKTINKLFARAGLPATTVAKLKDINDPANNMELKNGQKVSSLIWEIRRCRRCELIFDKGIRYWDLVRWHQLELLDSTEHPNIALGANVTDAPIAVANVNGYIDAANGSTRVFNEREYLYPIPSGQLQLNSKLTQNPGW